MNTYFKILGLEENADKQQIKRAYFKMIRKYPPEIAPEEFKKIREAYDYLIQNEAQKQVSAALDLPIEFQNDYQQVSTWFSHQEYKKAIQLCQEVLSKQPLDPFQFLLGKLYLLTGDAAHAIEQLQPLSENNTENMTYLFTLGYAFSQDNLKEDALAIYDTLYEKAFESMDFYTSYIELLYEKQRMEDVIEVSFKTLAFFQTLASPNKIEQIGLNSILLCMIDCLQDSNPEQLPSVTLTLLPAIKQILEHTGMLWDTIFTIYCTLVDCYIPNSDFQTTIHAYHEYIILNQDQLDSEKHILFFTYDVQLELLYLLEDNRISPYLKKDSGFWYGSLLVTLETNLEQNLVNSFEPFSLIQEKHRLLDCQLYLIYILDEIKDSLPIIKKEYSILSRCYGKFLDKLLLCDNQEHLFKQYEEEYKQYMNIPLDAKLVLSTEQESISEEPSTIADNSSSSEHMVETFQTLLDSLSEEEFFDLEKETTSALFPVKTYWSVEAS